MPWLVQLTMLLNILVWVNALVVLLVICSIFWGMSLALGSPLYAAALILVIFIVPLGTIIMWRQMRRQRILRRGTPGRVRVLRVEDGSPMLIGDDWPYIILTVEVVEGGPRRTIIIGETLWFLTLPEVGDELEVLFDARSPDLAIIRPGTL